MNNKVMSSELRVPSCEFRGLNPKPQTRNPKLQPRFAAFAARGFSLIELMVSMVIGLFILAGVVYVMANSRKNYETTDYTARLQENARFALHYLGYDLRNAGFFGCSDQGTWLVTDASYGAIEGEDHQSLATLYGDRIRIEYADPNNVFYVQSGATDGSNTVALASTPDDVQIKTGDWVIISDCSGATDAVITKNGAQLTLDKTLTRDYSGTVEVRKLISHRYYVAPSTNGGNFGVLCHENQKGAVNDPGSSPVCTNASTSTLDRTDLVQGVEYMRVLYGLDTSGDGAPDSYVPYSDTLSWNQVVAVQLGLLIRSVSNYRPEINPNREFGSAGAGDVDAKTYPILDKTAVDPVNLRVARRVITETIHIRNAVMSSPSA